MLGPVIDGHGQWIVVARCVGAQLLQLEDCNRATFQVRVTVSYMFEVMMSIPGKFYLLHLIAHAAGQFSLSNVTVSAESVGGSTPGVRVTWKTTTPLECVTYVRVEFRASSRGPMVAI